MKIALAGASAALALAACCWLLVPAASAAGPAVTVSLSPSLIAADGTSTSTATATVTDSGGNPVVGDDVEVASSDPGDNPGATPTPMTDNHDGTYTATITSSTTPGHATITATDTSASGISGAATLTQFGPAAGLTLQLSPASIVANGTSTSVATATVTDASGDPVPGEAVTFGFSDGRAQAGGNDNHDGSYTATISSPTPGQLTITATDTSVASLSAQAVLAQTTGSSTTSVQALPAASVTNQVVTLVSTVSTNGSAAAISGSITFTNFGVPIGCSDEAVSTSNPTATCQVSFTALRSPEQITATFAPDANAGVAGSAGTLAVPVTSDSTATALHASVPSPAIGGTTRYTATVVARHPGFALPSGSVEFVDNAHVVSACAHQPLRLTGASLTASCSVKYTTPGTAELVAHYLGDRDFRGSVSSVRGVRIRPLPKLSSRLEWSFRSTPTYTKVLNLVASRVSAGSHIVAICHGRGCPFAKRVIGLAKSGHKRTVDLTARFSDNRLSVNAQLTVEIVRPNFIGRYFNFVVRSGRSPRVRVSCIAPGGLKPGVGC
jgi:hypothetical protein